MALTWEKLLSEDHMSTEYQKVKAAVRWVEIPEGVPHFAFHGNTQMTARSFVMEVAGGCLVRTIAITLPAKSPAVAMQFIIGARLSDFTGEEAST